MVKKFLGTYALFVLIGLASLVFVGCDDLTRTAVVNGVTNAQSSTTKQGVLYTFYNNSSYTVTVVDLVGRDTIAPGSSKRFRYNKDVTIDKVKYAPSVSVKVEQFGSEFTFTNR
ncbi:MAG: hypothetical protein ACTTH8_04950 [Treponema sp.]